MYVTATPVCVLLTAGVSVTLVAADAASAIFSVAVAPPKPWDDAVMVAVPDVEAVKLVIALPLTGVIGVSVDPGLNEPETPRTENVMGLVAVVAVLPAASLIVAV
ncbi:MAG: hypothetical protein ABI612_19045 [Betaproteobacteria bacterium]